MSDYYDFSFNFKFFLGFVVSVFDLRDMKNQRLESMVISLSFLFFEETKQEYILLQKIVDYFQRFFRKILLRNKWNLFSFYLINEIACEFSFSPINKLLSKSFPLKLIWILSEGICKETILYWKVSKLYQREISYLIKW